MVNPSPPDVASCLAGPVQALLDSDIAAVITDERDGQSLIVWVNPAFTRSTGYESAQVVSRDARLLLGEHTDRQVAQEFAAAIRAQRPHTATLLTYRADGSSFWNQVSASPIRDPDRSGSYWISIQQDVSDRLEERAQHEASIAQERKARSGLTVISQVSELLTDLDDPHLLRQVSSLLRQETARWSEFFLDHGGGLHSTFSLTLDPTKHTRLQLRPPQRGQRLPGRPERDTPAALVEHHPDESDRGPLLHEQSSRHHAVSGVESKGSPGEQPGDRVKELLEGRTEMVVDFDLRTPYPPGSASAWLVGRIRPRLDKVDPHLHHVVLLPIRGRRRTLGLLAALPQEVAETGEIDVSAMTILDLVARRVGMAVENVQLYDREHRLAETLQRAMLPELAEVPGLDVWTYYAPNAEHAQVGGDWYDVLELDEGVAAVVVGDVVGHDVEAAAAMGQLRSVVRAYAVELSEPATVLQRVDQLVSGMRLRRSASMIYATLSRGEGTWELAHSRAGHLPIIHVRDGEPTALLDPGGLLIGFSDGPRHGGQRTLIPGDVLLFYTDGLIERRNRALREGLEALLQAAREVTAVDAAGIGEDLLTRLADAPEDDVAIVVVRIPDPERDASATVTSPRQRRWVLSSEPASIGRARQFVVKTCRTWDIAEVASAELVVSELVANAVLHGWGHVALQLFETGGALRIEVEDGNPAPPVATDGHPGRVGGYGMQIVERLADWGWWPSSIGKVVWAKVRPTEPQR